MIHLALSDIPVSPDTRRMLDAKPGIAGCVVVGKGRVIAFGTDCDYSTMAAAEDAYPEAHAGWQKDAVEVSGRVQRALALVAGGSNVNAAARAVGVNSSAVYRARTLRASRTVCPCCGYIKSRRPVPAPV